MINDGGPAFPRPDRLRPDGNGGYSIRGEHDGMTLRDWFAGQYIMGRANDARDTYAERARSAYRMADAMLAEREWGSEEWQVCDNCGCPNKKPRQPCPNNCDGLIAERERNAETRQDG